MKTDIILSGVGGQGILSIATIIGESQRGGDVQSNLRLSDAPIASDLIALGTADMIISLEPMEALRYLPYLSKDGWIITSAAPFKNIPNYPDEEKLMQELKSQPHVVVLDVENLAKENHMPKNPGCRSPARKCRPYFCVKRRRSGADELSCLRYRS